MRLRTMKYACAAAGLLVLAYVAGCRRNQPTGRLGRPTSVPVVLRAVKAEPVQRYVDAVGTLYADEDATVSSKVSGKIAAIYHDVGDRVAADEPLAQVSPVDYDLECRKKRLAAREPLAKLGLSELPPEDFDLTNVPTVRKAKLQADNAEAKYQRGRQLHEQKPPLISDQDFADLKTAWEVARSNYEVELLTARALLAQARSLQADLDIAEQRLADTMIRAPATQPAVAEGSSRPRSYAVAARYISVGEFVRESTPAFRLIDDDIVKLRASVPERFVREVRVGQEVRLRVDAYEQEFVGRVARVNPQVDAVSRTFQLEALVPNPQHLLKPGSFAQARVLSRVDPKAVYVPLEAVVSYAGVNKVFVVIDGRAAERIVELGDRKDEWVEALSGLNGDEQVVVEGVSRLADGVAVSIRRQPATMPARR